MKIGEFAKKYDKKKSTIRHYTELKLLVPTQLGAYPDYDENCIADMDKTLNLVHLGLSLEEIQTLMTFERLMIHNATQESKLVGKLMDQHINKTLNHIAELENRLVELKKYKEKLTHQQEDLTIMGSSINCLDFLQCPYCHRSFHMQHLDVENNMIMNGDLHCDCGRFYYFQDGILRDNNEKPQSVVPPLKLEDIKDIRNRISPDMMSASLSSGIHLIESLKHEKDHSAILFLGSDSDIATMGLNKGFREDGKYLFLSDDFDNLKQLKKLLANQYAKGEFLFLSVNKELPLKQSISSIYDCASFAYEAVISATIGSQLQRSLLVLKGHCVNSLFISSNTTDHVGFSLLHYINVLKNNGFEITHRKDLSAFDKTPEFLPSFTGTSYQYHYLTFKKITNQ